MSPTLMLLEDTNVSSSYIHLCYSKTLMSPALMLLEDTNVSSSLYYLKTLMSPTLNMIINYRRSAYEGYPSIFNFKAKAVSLCSQGYRCNLSEIVRMRCD